MDSKTVYQKMLSDFMHWQKNNDTYSKLWNKVRNGKASYSDAQDYSKLVAGKWGELLKEYFGAGVDVGGMSADDVAKDIGSALNYCYKITGYYTSKVQEVINDSVNININAVEGKIDKSRIRNLLRKLQEGKDISQDILVTADNMWLIDVPVVENIAMSAVTDTLIANAKLHTDAGLTSYIERKQGVGGCCKWCASVAGRYVYGEQPDDFFQVHKHCNCIITYMPSRQRWQKITYTTENGKRRKITEEL